MTANELTERCDASGPTIYRRIDRLRDQDLLEARTKPDTDGGHHEQVYVATLSRVTVTLEDGVFDLEIDRRESIADRFTRLVEEM
jgi:predicted transcriptional regulator